MSPLTPGLAKYNTAEDADDGAARAGSASGVVEAAAGAAALSGDTTGLVGTSYYIS